jgi:hypothetical protein
MSGEDESMTNTLNPPAEDLEWKQTLRRRAQQWFENRMRVADRVLAMFDGVALTI